MKKYFVTGLLFSGLTVFAFGQHYTKSAGVRLGHTSGLTFKKFVAGEEAVEFMASGRRDGFQLTIMYVNHQPMEFSFNENFYAYYGLGGHAGFERFDRLRKSIVSIDPDYVFEYEEQTYFVMGIDAILGIEYRWLSVPITIGFDIKPYFNYIGMRYTQARFWDSALSFKYVF